MVSPLGQTDGRTDGQLTDMPAETQPPWQRYNEESLCWPQLTLVAVVGFDGVSSSLHHLIAATPLDMSTLIILILCLNVTNNWESVRGSSIFQHDDACCQKYTPGCLIGKHSFCLILHISQGQMFLCRPKAGVLSSVLWSLLYWPIISIQICLLVTSFYSLNDVS